MQKNFCNLMRDRIVNIDYQPGESLSEKKLAEEFGVSRTPIREALIRLSEENLVTITPNKGSRVSDINFFDLQDLIGLRLILERGVAQLAVKNATDKNIQELQDLYKRVKHTDQKDISVLIDLDKEFHMLVCKTANNKLLTKSLSIIRNQFTRLQKLMLNKPDGMPKDIPEAIQAFREKDEDKMVAIMEGHVMHFVEKVRNHIF